MKTFSNARVGNMSYHNTMTKPKELILKVIIVVRMKIHQKQNNYNEDDSTLRL